MNQNAANEVNVSLSNGNGSTDGINRYVTPKVIDDGMIVIP